MAVARFWAPFLFLGLVPLGFWLGGVWSFSVLAAVPVALTLFDWLFGREAEAGGEAEDTPFRLLPWLYIPLQLGVIAWAAMAVANPATPLLQAIGVTISCGLTAGIFGFLAAHEMVHSRDEAEQAVGVLMLLAMLYPQFAIAHLQGHHRKGAAFDDPASARKGESLYAFFLRSIAGQAREAWTFEGERLARTGRPVFGPGNRLMVWWTIEAAILLVIGAVSLRALAFFLADGVLAILLLEGFNYIAHYGLTRRVQADGRLERLGPQHSWNSARRMNNASLFNMGRHSDHHRFAARQYQMLEVIEGGAELPSGYAAAILTALVPPLWFKVMDRRVDAALSGTD